MLNQMTMFEEIVTTEAQPLPRTTVRLGSKAAKIPLRKRRQEALRKLMGVIEQLEGKDVHISTCGGSRSHFWLDNLKLGRLKIEAMMGSDDAPSVLVLRGSRDACVRIFTDCIIDVREQDYQGFTMWLVDFWNGFGGYPINKYKPTGYTSLNLIRFKD